MKFVLYVNMYVHLKMTLMYITVCMCVSATRESTDLVLPVNYSSCENTHTVTASSTIPILISYLGSVCAVCLLCMLLYIGYLIEIELR